MARVDNFEQIYELMTYTQPDTVYMIQIIQRKKENPEMPYPKDRTVYNYYAPSVDKLRDKEEFIKIICEIMNARAYINLNEKSQEKACYDLQMRLIERARSRQFSRLHKDLPSVIAKAASVGEKRWVIDMDKKDFQDFEAAMCQVIREIQEARPVGHKVLDIIPTPNGRHIITTPFNVGQVTRIDWERIKRNDSTVLYA